MSTKNMKSVLLGGASILLAMLVFTVTSQADAAAKKCPCGDDCKCCKACCGEGGECPCGDDCKCCKKCPGKKAKKAKCTCGDDCKCCKACCGDGKKCKCGDDCKCCKKCPGKKGKCCDKKKAE